MPLLCHRHRHLLCYRHRDTSLLSSSSPSSVVVTVPLLCRRHRPSPMSSSSSLSSVVVVPPPLSSSSSSLSYVVVIVPILCRRRHRPYPQQMIIYETSVSFSSSNQSSKYSFINIPLLLQAKQRKCANHCCISQCVGMKANSTLSSQLNTRHKQKQPPYSCQQRDWNFKDVE